MNVHKMKNISKSIAINNNYRIEQNFGGKIFWRICDFETLAEKTLANHGLPAFLL